MSLLTDKIKNTLDSRDGFLKSVSILAGGTAFAQVIGVIVLPIITRLYTPEDFALFAVYSSILAILSVSICLRLEIAIPIPENEEDALALFILALISNIILTILISVIILLFQDLILKGISQPLLRPFIWFLPISVFFSGLYNNLQYWTTRKKDFNTIARTRMTKSLASSTMQIGGGYFSLAAFGLILGQFLDSSAGVFRLSMSFLKDMKKLKPKISFQRLKENWKKYNKFPKYSTFEALANVAAIKLPIVIIAAVALGPEAGYLMLATKVMAIPMGLVGGAISQVYLAHAPRYYNGGNLREYTVKTIRQIAVISIAPLIFIGITAPFFVPLVFGEDWATAGYMLLWMIPWFIMQILSSPVSMSLHITGNQKTALVLQVLGILIRPGGLLLISISFSNWAFEYYAISGFLFYFIYFFVILNILKYDNHGITK